MGLRRLIPLAALGAAFLGCSSGSGSGTGSTHSGDPSTPAGFCDGTFGKLVSTLEQTCSAADKQTDSYQFLFGIMQVLVAQCAPLLSNSVASGRATLDGNAAATCVAAYDEIVQQVNLGNTDDLDPAIIAACQSVVSGNQALGAPCAQPYECANGASCVGRTSTSDGTCQIPAIGETCGNGESASGEVTITLNFGSHPECASGAFCDSVYENSEFVDRCVALEADGEDCFEGDECLAGGCHLGKCSSAGPSAVGMECVSSDDCADDLYCDDASTPSVCAPKKGTGETCSGGLLSNECQGRCNQAEGAQSGTCAPFCGQG